MSSSVCLYIKVYLNSLILFFAISASAAVSKENLTYVLLIFLASLSVLLKNLTIEGKQPFSYMNSSIDS